LGRTQINTNTEITCLSGSSPDERERPKWHPEIRAFDSRLFADATNPFIGAGRRAAGLPGFPILETAGITILFALVEMKRPMIAFLPLEEDFALV
jgi:hypothetical protein